MHRRFPPATCPDTLRTIFFCADCFFAFDSSALVPAVASSLTLTSYSMSMNCRSLPPLELKSCSKSSASFLVLLSSSPVLVAMCCVVLPFSFSFGFGFPTGRHNASPDFVRQRLDLQSNGIICNRVSQNQRHQNDHSTCFTYPYISRYLLRRIFLRTAHTPHRQNGGNTRWDRAGSRYDPVQCTL